MQNNNNENKMFDWQFNHMDVLSCWKKRKYDCEKYWGGFPKDIKDYEFPEWSIQFEKFCDNPVFKPSKKGWDCGYVSGGVHNGSIIKHNNDYYYIYRGERPLQKSIECFNDDLVEKYDYICDIGIAKSNNGIDFSRIGNGLFRYGDDEKYSYEDVCVVRHNKVYYLFCNRWYWEDCLNTKLNGVFLATSKDLIKWEKHGLVFYDCKQIHRNACVLQDANNNAIKINNKFIMYLNNGIVATSEDMINWESKIVPQRWNGGEGCFALYLNKDFKAEFEGKILLFTGGHHTGHFYAIGEVLFDSKNPFVPIDYLKKPVLIADNNIPYENGLSYKSPHNIISSWRDTVFFTGMTIIKNKLHMYYGGSEYYTCLAISK